MKYHDVYLANGVVIRTRVDFIFFRIESVEILPVLLIGSIPRDVLEYGNPPYFEKRRRLTVITVLHTHNKLQVITASIINVCNKVPCGFETRLISYCCAELTRLIVDITTRAGAL